MTSGRILGVLVRAHALTNNTTYLELADEVFRKLSQKRELGGMTTYGKEQTAWLEEVAFPGSNSFKVLNGHIFSLAGVYDYANYTHNPDAVLLFNQGVNAVATWIESFDSGFLSYYCEKIPSKANRVFAGRGGYNVIHIHQMLWLYEVSGNPVFLKKAMAFQFYEDHYPEINANHSTDKKSHGPEKMNLSFGRSYWASNKFPVQINLKLKENSLLTGMTILSHTVKSTPADFIVESSMNGTEWIKVIKEAGNKKQRKTITFNKPVMSRTLRLTVEKDNGNGAVALDGVGLLYDQKNTSIINFSNYGVGLKRIFDANLKTGLKVKENGWLLIPNITRKTKKLVVYGNFNFDTTGRIGLFLEGSNQLDGWNRMKIQETIDKTKVVLELPLKKYKYYRLHFKKKWISKINEVVLKKKHL